MRKKAVKKIDPIQKMANNSMHKVILEADIQFLKMIMKYKKINLIQNEGLDGLIEKVNEFISISQNEAIYLDHYIGIEVLKNLCLTLKKLWYKNIDFAIQLRSMNTGQYTYGTRGNNSDLDNFKDFELEIFIASQLANNCDVTLPTDTEGEDVICEGIYIQCKHPVTLSSSKYDNFGRDFNSRLKSYSKANGEDQFGILAIGIDDLLLLGNNDEIIKEPNLYIQKIKEYDAEFAKFVHEKAQYHKHIVGVITVNTLFYGLTNGNQKIQKTVNSVLFVHKSKKVHEDQMRKIYKTLAQFNPQPHIIEFN